MQRFSRIGNDPALDFIDTESAAGDAIRTFEDFFDWLIEAELLTTDEAKDVLSVATGAQLLGLLGLALALRWSMRRVVDAYVAGQTPPANQLAIINEHLQVTPVRHEIVPTQGGLTSVQRVAPEQPRDLLYLVAEAARELFTRKDPHLIKRCANPECTHYFYDASKNGTRRWCSMAACGTRQKVATLRGRINGTRALQARHNSD